MPTMSGSPPSTRATTKQAQARRIAQIERQVCRLVELMGQPTLSDKIRSEKETLSLIRNEVHDKPCRSRQSGSVAEQRQAAVYALLTITNDLETRTHEVVPTIVKSLLCALLDLDSEERGDSLRMNPRLLPSGTAEVPAQYYGFNERNWVMAKAAATASILMAFWKDGPRKSYDDVADKLREAGFTPNSGGPREKNDAVSGHTIEAYVLKAEAGRADFQEDYEYHLMDILCIGCEEGKWNKQRLLDQSNRQRYLKELKETCREFRITSDP